MTAMGAVRNILHIEDDDDHAALVARCFSGLATAHKLTRIADGASALQYLQQDPVAGSPVAPSPDLVLLDLRLPKVDGLDVLRWIKADDRVRRTPVVILTTSAADPDVERAYALHANSYLVKPPDYGVFQSMMQAVERYWLRFHTFPRGALGAG